MRVEIHSGVFSVDDGVATAHDLIRLFLEGRHDWIVHPDQVDEVSDFFKRHFPTLSPVYTEFAVKASAAQAWMTHADAPLLVTAHTIHDDVWDLRQPAVLLVEDEFSDRCFLLAVARVFEMTSVAEAEATHRLDIRHCGGKDRAYRQALHVASRFRRTIRAALLLDSDRFAPGQVTRCHKIADNARAVGVQVHVLELREVENYVPNKVLAMLQPIRETTKKIDALKTLTPEQRGYFDMKKGFPARGLSVSRVPPGHEALYDGVPNETIDKLREGFGSNLAELMERAAADGRLTRSDFEKLGEGIATELRQLLAMLQRII
ncbi:hypothetical protein AB0C14_14210 [Microbispora hainanensis]|uniref:hypothetical protein n=1 Tax=Microbispora hainanensis TaxID=568844 RepID=UPI0033D17A31